MDNEQKDSDAAASKSEQSKANNAATDVKTVNSPNLSPEEGKKIVDSIITNGYYSEERAVGPMKVVYKTQNLDSIGEDGKTDTKVLLAETVLSINGTFTGENFEKRYEFIKTRPVVFSSILVAGYYEFEAKVINALTAEQIKN